MRKTICAVLALLLTLTLCACAADKPDTVPTQNDTQTPTQAGQGDVIDPVTPRGMTDEISPGVYYYELITSSGDVGDGLTPLEGAKLAEDLLISMDAFNGGIADEQCLYISYDEITMLDSVMGRECYIYSVGIGTVAGGFKGDDYQVVYRVSVDYSGDKTAALYEDFSGGQGDIVPDGQNDGQGDIVPDDQGGGDVIGSDPGDTGKHEWWGTYVSSGYSVDITEVDNKSFHFVIKMIGTTQNTTVFEGSANIDETGLFATSGSTGFSLYDDYSAIDIFAAEGSEWADLRGQYQKIE